MPNDLDLIRRGDAKAAVFGVAESTLFACTEVELPFNRRDLYDAMVAALLAPAAAEVEDGT